MKKIIIILAGVSIGTVLLAGRYKWEGAGKKITATTTPQVLLVTAGTNNWAYGVSIDNLGSQTICIQYGNSTNNFVATNAIPIAAGKSYTSMKGSGQNEVHSRKITGIIYATTNSTASANVAFE